jgi:LemA protein
MNMRGTGIIFLIVVALFSTSCGYNVMQANEEAVMKSWGDIDSQLQRRSDLIPNLVETVKGYAKHEKETLTAVIEARAKATSVQIKAENLADPKAMEQFSKAQGELSSALARLMVVVEKYPALKANENFRDLQHQLEGTENRISVARQRYNKAVESFNYSIRSFPNSLTNSLILKLERKEYFKADEAARTAPKVQF